MKRDPRLRGLSEDHHHALFLARRIRFALEEGERQLAEELTASGWTKELAPHLEAEEEVLVPAMQAAGMQVLAARILRDHAALSDARARGLAGDAEQLARFAEVLVEHVRFEERVAFPAVEEGLSNEALAAVSARTPWGRR